MYSIFRSVSSNEENREDTAEKTLTRLTEGWSNRRYELAPAEEIKLSFQEVRIGEDDESAFQKSEQTARQTLSRLSSEWSGKKTSEFAQEQDAMLEKTKLEAVLSADGKVRLNQIEEDTAPALLVDWKIWTIKIAVLILIPVALVMGGGIQHIADLYPNLAEYCHTQALAVYKTLPNDNSANVAYSHLALAKIHGKSKRYSKAISQAHSAANLYAIDCMTKIDRYPGKYLVSQRALGKSLTYLRESLVLAANTANEAGYDTLANKYWRSAMKLDPAYSIHMDEVREIVENRKKASNSLALSRQENDSIEALKGAIRILPAVEASSIYNCRMNRNVTASDIESFKRAIDLHLRLARLYKRYNHGIKAYQEISTANNLRSHLLHYLALKELNQKWTPRRLSMSDVYVSFNINTDGAIWDLEAQGNNEILNVREAVMKYLNNKFDWHEDSTKFNSLAGETLVSTKIHLIFTRRGVTVPREFQDSYVRTELLSPQLRRLADYRPAIQQVSRSL